jgi:antirestriction protein ArdC
VAIPATSGMRRHFAASSAMTTTTPGVPTTVFPGNAHPVRPATAHDAKALRKLAAVSGARPLAGRVLVAEVGGVIAAAISRDEPRTIADPALAPAYLTTILRLRADALAAVARQPSLAERMREAVSGARQPAALPLAA